MIRNISLSVIVGIIVFVITTIAVLFPIAISWSSPPEEYYGDNTAIYGFIDIIIQVAILSPIGLFVAGLAAGIRSIQLQTGAEKTSEKIKMVSGSGYITGLVCVGFIGLCSGSLSSIMVGLLAGIISLIGSVCVMVLVYLVQYLKKRKTSGTYVK